MLSSLRSLNAALGAGLALLASLLTGFPSLAQQTPTVSSARDYLYPDNLLLAERHALIAQAIATRRLADVNPVEVIEFLQGNNRRSEVLIMARGAARQKPENIEDIADKLAELREWIYADEPIQSMLAEMRSRLDELSPEQRARAAYAVLSLELNLNRTALNFSTRAHRTQPLDGAALLRKFTQEFAGTPEAGLAEFEALMEYGSDPNKYTETLDQFARAHPGTLAGAKALYLLGQAKGMTQCCDEISVRFQEVLKIVADLESGKFPSSKWVTEAPQLIGLFRVEDYEALKLSPESFERIIAGYKEFIQTHPDNPQMGTILTLRLPTIFHPRRALDKMDSFFEEPAGNPPTSDAARFLRALADTRPRRWVDETDDRSAFLARSNATLQELSVQGSAPWRQRALAMLASQLFNQRDYKAAMVAYNRYLTEFPDSGWNWVAAIRLGQSQAESRDFEAARKSFQAAAATYRARPFARAVALAYAAQSSAALNDASTELTDLKQALDAWDPNLGASFAIGQPFTDPFFDFTRIVIMGRDPNPPSFVLDRELRREKLAARATEIAAR
jgi:TolA-binding protein